MIKGEGVGMEMRGGERVEETHVGEMMQQQQETEKQHPGYPEKQLQEMKLLLNVLSLVSRSVPVPNQLIQKVSSIALNGAAHNLEEEEEEQHDCLQMPPPPADQSGDCCVVGTTTSCDKDAAAAAAAPPPPPPIAPDIEEGLKVCKKDKELQPAAAAAAEGINLLPEAVENKEEEEEKEEGKEFPSFFMPGQLLAEFEEAMAEQQSRYKSAALLRREQQERIQRRLTQRSRELQEDSPLYADEKVRQSNLVEQQSLKLMHLQQKVRNDVVAELYLQQTCADPRTHLFDWGLMRIRRRGISSSHFGGPLYAAAAGVSQLSGPHATEADERLRRKREAERQRRLEEEERVRETTRKRKFFNELLNVSREYLLQSQATSKRRKQRNDGIQAWHGKQRQRATRAERLRFQALKSDDQEAYMRLVEESKNERLTTLLSRTDDLLQRLGAMVQQQKNAEPEDTFTKKDKVQRERGSTMGGVHPPPPKDAAANAKDTQNNTEIVDMVAVGAAAKKRDLLEGQRQYNSAVHSIEEIVSMQPAMLVGGQLRQYQIEGLQWMLSLYNNNLNGILADEMGLGKTIQTIALLAYLLENKGVAGPHIIIAPKAVLPNWAHELTTWAPSLTVVLYDGRAEERRLLREEHGNDSKFNVLVTHYDLIMRDKAFLKKIRWHYMIVDEGHRLKNHDCMLSRTLVSGYHIRRRLLLTGTPIQNSLQELWSLLNFLLPAIFNSSENFEDWFNAPFTDRSEVSLTEEEQLLVIRRLHQVIRPFLLRRKKAEVEKFLPSKTQVILKCDLSAWQRLYYRQIVESGRVGLDSGTGKSRGLLNTAMQLRKCCNHPYLFLEGRDYDPLHSDELIRSSGKFELLDRLLPKLLITGHRVLLFSQMTRLMDILEDYLELHGFKYLRLDGTTKTEDRGTLLQQFNAPESPIFIFLLSTRAGGLGLNLQTADTVILFDSDWNPQMDQQAEDRAHRIGQKKEVRVFVLVSVGSIEEEILLRAKSKMGIDAKVIQAGLFNTTSTAQERRDMLEEIMRRGTDALGTDVPSEREINRLSARGDDEFQIFEEMDEERRQKEGYCSRLLQEHEVPDWVFLNDPGGGNDDSHHHDSGGQITGKRSRKEVVYTDTLSETQWVKAIEQGTDVQEAVKLQIVKRNKKKQQQLSTSVDADRAVINGVAFSDDEKNTYQDGTETNGATALIPDQDVVVSVRKRTTLAAESVYSSDLQTQRREVAGAELESSKREKHTRILLRKKKESLQARGGSHGGTSKEGGGAKSRLQIVLRAEKEGGINWNGLRRKRSRPGSTNTEEDFVGEEQKETGRLKHNNRSDDDDDATLEG